MRINNTNVVDAAEGSEKESFMIRWMTGNCFRNLSCFFFL